MSYIEMMNMIQDSNLRLRVAAACIVAAEAIRVEASSVTGHTERLVWARSVFFSPTQMAERLMPSIIAQNSAATVAAVQSASDASIQSAVNAAFPAFV